MMRLLLKWLLIPLSKLYGLGVAVRNWLFDSELLVIVQPSTYTISVGNLTVGGTGKTPMIELLIERYAQVGGLSNGAVATLSRGYGRKTTGFRIAHEADTAETIGDEPRQLYRKFSPTVRVCVGERRVAAIEQLLEQYPETKMVLLDDAFQHRAVRPHVTMLLMDYTRPFYTDYPFPAGRLREPRRGAKRADCIVVTKCPLNLWVTEQQQIIDKIRRYAQPDAPVFFAGLQYAQPVSFATRQAVTNLKNVVLVSGLANAMPLENYVRQTYQLHQHHRFADHYAYSRTDLNKLIAELPPSTALLTTEKDWVKLDALLSPTERATWPLFYLPVAMQFLPEMDAAFNTFLDQIDLKFR